jgi:hypothetical protein
MRFAVIFAPTVAVPALGLEPFGLLGIPESGWKCAPYPPKAAEPIPRASMDNLAKIARRVTSFLNLIKDLDE